MTDRICTACGQVRADLIAFLQRLVRIPSLPGSEADAHACAADEMRTLGLDVRVLHPTRAALASHPAFSDDGLPIETRPSVVGRWRGRGGGRSLILNGHLDVVSAGDLSRWTQAPWGGEIAGGRLYGRGACDMKAGVAAAVYAIAALRRAGIEPGGDLLVETVSGEESGGMGTLTTIVEGIRADAAIILEPTGLSVCPVQAGALTFRLTVRGRAAHGALRQAGVSAADKLWLLAGAIARLEDDRHAAWTHPSAALYPAGQLVAPISIGTVRAGDWPSTVPETAVAEGRFGIFPGETLPEARRRFEDAVAAAAATDEWLAAHPPTIEWVEGQFEPGATPADAPILQALGAVHRRVTGEPATVRGVTYGSDLRLFTNHAGMPAVLYGPGRIEQAHAVDEFVDLDEVMTACEVIAGTVAEWSA